MIKSNYITDFFKRRENLLGVLCFAAGYCLLFSFMENPKYKTISLIAKENLGLFLVFCILYFAAMLGNFHYMFERFSVKSKTLRIVGYISNLVFPFALTTLMPPLESGGEVSTFATIVHWICGFGNIAANATVVLVSCLVISKALNNKKLKTVCAVGSVISILDLLVFVFMGVVLKDVQKAKNGIFEIIPLAVTFVVLFVINHTDIAIKRSERDAEESRFTVCDKSPLSAVSFVLLVSAAAMFTFYAFVRNPIRYTISMTGIDYPVGFAIVSVLLSLCFLFNFILMFKRHSYKNVLAWVLAVIGSVAIIACVAVPTTMAKNISTIHALGALIYFYFTMAAFVLYFGHMRKSDKRYTKPLVVMLSVVAATVITLVVMFIILQQKYGRTGLTELVPLEVMFAFFLNENFVGERREAVKESKESVVKL